MLQNLLVMLHLKFNCKVHQKCLNILKMLNHFLLMLYLEKKKSRPESVDCTPADYIIPGSSERPLVPLQPQSKELKGPNCIKVLTTSGWNPPPGLYLSTKLVFKLVDIFYKNVFSLL